MITAPTSTGTAIHPEASNNHPPSRLFNHGRTPNTSTAAATRDRQHALARRVQPGSPRSSRPTGDRQHGPSVRTGRRRPISHTQDTGPGITHSRPKSNSPSRLRTSRHHTPIIISLLRPHGPALQAGPITPPSDLHTTGRSDFSQSRHMICFCLHWASSDTNTEPPAS